jgi:hypothetical protein
MRLRHRLGVVLAVVALAGCSVWAQGRADGGRSGNNAVEKTITAANVGGLVETSHIVAQVPTDPVVNSVRTLALGGTAYDLNSCGPTSCHRMLTASEHHPAFVDDTIYGITSTTGRDWAIGAFADQGPETCRTRPSLCPPQWFATLPATFDPAQSVITDFVIDRDAIVAHVSTVNFTVDRFELWVVSWDIGSNATCPVGPSGVRTCVARWAEQVGTAEGQFDPVSDLWRPVVTYGGHVVSLREQTPFGAIQARDMDGHEIWNADGYFDGDPVLTTTRVWATLASGAVVAFDGRGVAGCTTVAAGQPRSCSPLLTAVPPSPATGMAVTADAVYVTARDGRLYVFDAHGDAGCSGTPKVCAPLWSATADTRPVFAPTVAGDVVYTVTKTEIYPPSPGILRAFDAKGISGCSGTPKVCAPLKEVPLATGPSGPVAVGGGTVVVPTFGLVRIFKVPA